MTKEQAQKIVAICGALSIITSIITTVGVLFGGTWLMFFLYCVVYTATSIYMTKNLGNYSNMLFVGAQTSNVIAAFAVFDVFGPTITVLWFVVSMGISLLVKQAGPIMVADILDKAISPE